jgi:UDPglucose--hexose-1-phosphate uridylyltransferase
VIEIRRNLITGEPILFAPERAERPNAFEWRTGASACPFCPGNEEMTPPEIARVGDPWRVRVFPNKYPFAEHHEVIVESPSHDAGFDSVDANEVARVYLDRYRALAARPGVKSVALFKNHGRTAGASLEHLHSQIAALTFVPPRIASESSAFARAKSCPLCDAITTHRVAGLVIDETESMVWLAPHGSTFAHQQWLIPKRHVNDFAAFDERETNDLASLLQSATAGARKIAASHNWLFVGFPGTAAAHGYVDVFPRMTSVAGFELLTGTFIDVVDPAATARLLADR